MQGKVLSDERNIAELTARFGGRIEKLFVNYEGQKVQKGEKLATIYSPALVTAQRELLEALAFKETRPSIYEAAKGKLKLWDLTDEQISSIENKGEPLVYFNVLSPISGTVRSRNVSEGEEIAINGVFKIDAAAQLAGKPSMMNPNGGMGPTGHDHSGMDMGNDSKEDYHETEMMEMKIQNENTGKNLADNFEHVMFKVAGNCSLCKDRIEAAAKSLEGVNNAEWDEETKIVHINFINKKITPDDIHKAIAAVGHDTEKEKAPDEVYNKLPDCCKYRNK